MKTRQSERHAALNFLSIERRLVGGASRGMHARRNSRSLYITLTRDAKSDCRI
jgi:hypothetical protein